MAYTVSDGIINTADQIIQGPLMNKKSSSKISIFSSSSEIQRTQCNKRKKHTTIIEQEEENLMYQTKHSNQNSSLVCIDLNQDISNVNPVKFYEDDPTLKPNIEESSN